MAVLVHEMKKAFDMLASAEGNNLAGLQKAIAAGAPVNYQSAHDSMTALHLAAGNGNEAMVDYLLDEGADVRLEDTYGRTASVVAIECGWYDLADHLTDLECQAIQREKLTALLKGTTGDAGKSTGSPDEDNG